MPLKDLRYHRYVNEFLPQAADLQAFHLIANGDSSWLATMPIGVCKFSDTEFKFAFKGRLRIPLSELQALPVKTCKCRDRQHAQGIIDVHGDHLMTCRHIKGPDRIVLHDNVVRYLASLDRQARILSEVEPRGKYIAVSTKKTTQRD